MNTENIMTQLPTPAIRNAIAFVDFYGDFARGTHAATRIAAQKYDADRGYIWVNFDHDYDKSGLGRPRFYKVTDEGREVAAKGALAKTLAWLKAEGFKFRNDRKPKLGFLNGFVHEDGRTAWISNSQSDTSSVYVDLPIGHPDRKGSGSVLTFTAKAG
jgi:hypothetical protein